MGQPSGRIGKQHSDKGAETEKIKIGEQFDRDTTYLSSSFAAPGRKHCQVLPIIVLGKLMTAAAREDKKSTQNQKAKTIDKQAEDSITSVRLVDVVLAGKHVTIYSRRLAHPPDSLHYGLRETNNKAKV